MRGGEETDDDIYIHTYTCTYIHWTRMLTHGVGDLRTQASSALQGEPMLRDFMKSFTRETYACRHAYGY